MQNFDWQVKKNRYTKSWFIEGRISPAFFIIQYSVTHNIQEVVEIKKWDIFLGAPVSSLTHWGRETHIYVGKLTIIASDNGLSPGRRQTIIWTNAGILLIGPLGTNFNEILIEIHTFSLKKMPLKMSSAKWRPFCLSLNVLTLQVPLDSVCNSCLCLSLRLQLFIRTWSFHRNCTLSHIYYQYILDGEQAALQLNLNATLRFFKISSFISEMVWLMDKIFFKLLIAKESLRT